MIRITFAYTLDRYELHMVTDALNSKLDALVVSPTNVKCNPEDRDVVLAVLDSMRLEYVTSVKKKSSRSVRPTGATRQELLSYNDGCCYLCNHESSTELHHVIHREDGGSNHWRNLAPLCSRCHRFIHQCQNQWKGFDGYYPLHEEFSILLMPIERTYCLNQEYLHQRWQWVRHLEEMYGSLQKKRTG